MTYIVEVFSGIQGEGPIVGYRQIFIRFSNCQLSCKYCDTDYLEKKNAVIEINPGKRDSVEWQNPISAKILSQHVLEMNKKMPHHSVSLTGGEPLLHTDYIQALTSDFKTSGIRTYLETNGLLYKALQDVIDNIDVIGMDIKLQSVTDQPTRWSDHEAFLAIARKKEVFVKLVISNETTKAEIIQAAKMLSHLDETIPLILQPLTPIRDMQAPSPGQLLDLMNEAMMILPDVRVIPQTHVMLKQQ